jgi:hypothetical protein
MPLTIACTTASLPLADGGDELPLLAWEERRFHSQWSVTAAAIDLGSKLLFADKDPKGSKAV